MFCGLALVAACGSESDREVVVTADTVVHVAGVFDSSRVRVHVLGENTPIVGRYTVTDSGVRFRPSFPFDSGRDYQVVVDKTRDSAIVHGFRLRAPDRRQETGVIGVFPSAAVLPENQLRLYVVFSAPMSRGGGLPYMRLLDAEGREVRNAFLPIEAEFWNRDHTRYTLFLDPGRVKRGILPNEQLGRALVAGRRYSIVVDSAWRDGNGQPLVSSYVKTFQAGPADYTPIRLDAWGVVAPRTRSIDPLVLRFNEALDFGLLHRAVGVERANGALVDGDITISGEERELRFVPGRPWDAGGYRVVVLDFLEDLAGNRVNRAFEVDMFTHADSTTKPSRYTIPFQVR